MKDIFTDDVCVAINITVDSVAGKQFGAICIFSFTYECVYIDRYDLEDFFIQFFLQELDIEIIFGGSFRDFNQLFIIMYNP